MHFIFTLATIPVDMIQAEQRQGLVWRFLTEGSDVARSVEIPTILVEAESKQQLIEALTKCATDLWDTMAGGL